MNNNTSLPIAEILTYGWPNANWVMLGDSYEDIDWREDSPKPTLEEIEQKALLAISARAQQQVTQSASDARRKLVNNANPELLSSWQDKAQRATRIITGNNTDDDTAILQAECDARGLKETPAQLAEKQAHKAKLLASIAAIIDGKEKAAIETIKKAKTQKTIDKTVATFNETIETLLTTHSE